MMNRMNSEIYEREVVRLYEAIMAKNRDEALACFREIFRHHHNRSVAEQRNLFPDRIPE